MRVREVRLHDFRCHSQLDVQLGPAVTVLVGSNGTGKTSVLEAIHLVLQGASPRTSQTKELISWGAEALRVEIELQDPEGRAVAAAAGYASTGERRNTAGGAPLTDLSRWEETCPVRAFIPDDVRLIKGSPRRRRRLLDRLATAIDPSYGRELAGYEEALLQRNSLLRKGVVGPDHDPWEALLARSGLRLAAARESSLRSLFGPYAYMHSLLAPAPSAPASLLYRTNVAALDEPSYRERLNDQRFADRRRTFTNLGPHRDDVRFTLGGRDLREYGSQGEQRTALLALVLAERSWVFETSGREQLLLLDDVMSELDDGRRRSLVALLSRDGQVVVTTTDLHYFTSEELCTMEVVELTGPAKRSGGS